MRIFKRFLRGICKQLEVQQSPLRSFQAATFHESINKHPPPPRAFRQSIKPLPLKSVVTFISVFCVQSFMLHALPGLLQLIPRQPWDYYYMVSFVQVGKLRFKPGLEQGNSYQVATSGVWYQGPVPNRIMVLLLECTWKLSGELVKHTLPNLTPQVPSSVGLGRSPRICKLTNPRWCACCIFRVHPLRKVLRGDII